MSITVTWDDDAKTILNIHFPQRWTWEDYHQALDTAFADIEALGHTVDIIVDAESGGRVPTGSVLANINHTVRSIPPMVGVIVVVPTSIFVRALIMVALKTSQRAREKGALAATRDEAYAVIARRRSRKPTP